VPDAEKLSWLVLGHGLNTAGDTDMAALQTAASTLLSESAAAGVQSQIATAFGLDSVSLSTSQDTLHQRIVTVGKQISSRLRISYQQGLETASSALLLRYTLSTRVTLEAEAGTRSALSLFYNIAFD
jgi:translocation and assembly module TamB